MELPVPQIIISVLLLRVVNQVHPYTHLVMNAEVVMQTILSATRNSFIDGQSVEIGGVGGLNRNYIKDNRFTVKRGAMTDWGEM